MLFTCFDDSHVLIKHVFHCYGF